MNRTILAAMFFASLLGCGKDAGNWGSVAGTITQNGKPVESAMVLFSNRDAGVEITAPTDAKGRFTIRTDRVAGLPLGTYKVAVTPKAVNLPSPKNGLMFEGPAPAQPPSAIPAAYRDVKTTKLTATVQTGPNEFTFDLL